jgi:hypothetical protein
MKGKKEQGGAMASTKKAKRRRQREGSAGDWVGIALEDGTWGVAQVVGTTYSRCPMIVLFSGHAAMPAELAPDAAGRPIAAMNVTGDMIEDGLWPILCTTEITPAVRALPRRDEGRTTVALSAVDILDHLHGVRPITPLLVDWHSEWLLPGVSLPPGVDDTPSPAAASGPEDTFDEDVEQVTSGPALVKIQIRYAGIEMPDDADAGRSHRIEDEIEKLGVGEVTDTGSGDGALDIWFETKDATKARAVVAELLEREGVTARSRVSVEALNDV